MPLNFFDKFILKIEQIQNELNGDLFLFLNHLGYIFQGVFGAFFMLLAEVTRIRITDQGTFLFAFLVNADALLNIA